MKAFKWIIAALAALVASIAYLFSVFRVSGRSLGQSKAEAGLAQVLANKEQATKEALDAEEAYRRARDSFKRDSDSSGV